MQRGASVANFFVLVGALMIEGQRGEKHPTRLSAQRHLSSWRLKASSVEEITPILSWRPNTAYRHPCGHASCNVHGWPPVGGASLRLSFALPL